MPPLIADHVISAVMVHVADVAAGLAWYERAFDGARRVKIASPAFEYLAVGTVRIEIVPSDSKVTSGPSGSVVYWGVTDFQLALRHFLNLGAILYRGPMQIEDGLSMCQVQDPWGNCIGLRGPNIGEAVVG
jgi:predicted enzyme related to lactoylglutathione lyase